MHLQRMLWRVSRCYAAAACTQVGRQWSTLDVYAYLQMLDLMLETYVQASTKLSGSS
jgi:hypothetical protein